MRYYFYMFLLPIICLKTFYTFKAGVLTFTKEEIIFYSAAFFAWMLFGQRNKS